MCIPAVVLLKRTFDFDNLTATQYTGHLKQAYELGYADTYGLVVSKDGSGFSIQPPFIVTSQVSGCLHSWCSRIEFSLTVPASNAQMYKDTTQASPSTLAAAIEHIVHDSKQLSDVSPPSAQDIEAISPFKDTADDEAAQEPAVAVWQYAAGSAAGLLVVGLLSFLAYKQYQKSKQSELEAVYGQVELSTGVVELDVCEGDNATSDVSPRSLDNLIREAAGSNGEIKSSSDEGAKLLKPHSEQLDPSLDPSVR